MTIRQDLSFLIPHGAFYDDADGIVGWSVEADLTPENLLAAYRCGVFPWPFAEGELIPWVCPDPRAILRFRDWNLPRTVRQTMQRMPWRYTIDHAFPEVIEFCSAQVRPGQEGTWITRAMRQAYVWLHRQGHAHSVEVWNRESGTLVGGLYGVDAGGVFTGESMFHRESGASKAALVQLVNHLSARGAAWMDVQQKTPLLTMFGAVHVSRSEYLKLLRKSLDQGALLFAPS